LEKEISKGDYQALGWDEVLFWFFRLPS
jgi:hypothetical protein